MIKTGGIEFLREEFAGIAWDKYDPWGCVASAEFDLAESWFLATGVRLWEYERGTPFAGEFGSERSERLYGAIKDGLITDQDVHYWYVVLDRMDDLVIKAGRDY